jgi:hypothetical protein
MQTGIVSYAITAVLSAPSGQSQLLLVHADGMQVGAIECRFIRNYLWFKVAAGRS